MAADTGLGWRYCSSTTQQPPPNSKQRQVQLDRKAAETKKKWLRIEFSVFTRFVVSHRRTKKIYANTLESSIIDTANHHLQATLSNIQVDEGPSAFSHPDTFAPLRRHQLIDAAGLYTAHQYEKWMWWRIGPVSSPPSQRI
jgi:hypothetical protein